jgi:hypothetical protein
MASHEPSSSGPVLLASGSHEDIGDWELHFRSEVCISVSRFITLLLVISVYFVLLATSMAIIVPYG